jgi:hypothetical protein
VLAAVLCRALQFCVVGGVRDSHFYQTKSPRNQKRRVCVPLFLGNHVSTPEARGRAELTPKSITDERL